MDKATVECHFQKLFYFDGEATPVVSVDPSVSNSSLDRPYFILEEVKIAIELKAHNKSPGPDGYGSSFFKVSQYDDVFLLFLSSLFNEVFYLFIFFLWVECPLVSQKAYLLYTTIKVQIEIGAISEEFVWVQF
jgi:hypothetical protein